MTAPMLLNVLEGEIATLRQDEIELVQDIALELGSEGDSVLADRQRLREIAQDLREMFFMVVVIGEFNAGKSTFINALLGYRLLETGITPTTEYIELVRYSEQPQTVPNLRPDATREWAHPNTGAEGVAIVDTPGTGSIFMKHEKIAKSFLHRSDLVIFLLSAKQAFAETERIYLEMAKNYGKKVVLVINQVDLLNLQEQSQVLQFVRSQVKDKLDLEPPIFMVSAKEGLASAPEDGGGMGAVKAHLRGVYSEARPARQKLLAELETVSHILQGYAQLAREKVSVVSLNVDKVKGIESELTSQSAGINARQKELNAEILNVLEGIRARGNNFIEKNLTISLKSIRGGLSKESLEQEFQEVVIGRSLRDMTELVTGYINTVVDQSRAYWNTVLERLNKLQDLLESRKAGFEASVYAEQRENLEQAIRIAEGELQANTSAKVLDDLMGRFNSNVGSLQRNGLVTLSGVLTMVIAIATPGGLALFPLVIPALLFGGLVTVVAGVPTILALNRATREAKTDFNNRVDTLIKSYSEALDDLTRKERNRLVNYGTQQLTPIYSRLDVLRGDYDGQVTQFGTFERQIIALRKRLEDVE